MKSMVAWHSQEPDLPLVYLEFLSQFESICRVDMEWDIEYVYE